MAERITSSDRQYVAGFFCVVAGLVALGFGNNLWLSAALALLVWASMICLCHIINHVNGHKIEDEPN